MFLCFKGALKSLVGPLFFFVVVVVPSFPPVAVDGAKGAEGTVDGAKGAEGGGRTTTTIIKGGGSPP